jgi:hypothetical protein
MTSPTRERRVIGRLLAARGIGRHTLFLTQREGLDLPTDLEAVSGFALDDRGKVHGFWLAWDPDQDAPTLAPFYPVANPEDAFADVAEYRQAKRRLGLPRV